MNKNRRKQLESILNDIEALRERLEEIRDEEMEAFDAREGARDRPD